MFRAAPPCESIAAAWSGGVCKVRPDRGPDRFNQNQHRRDAPKPVPIDGVEVSDWLQISLDTRHACGIRSNGELWCWGYSHRGQLGTDVELGYNAIPLRVTAGATAWRRVDTAAEHTCAIDVDNQLWCFGADGRGTLGDGGSAPTRPQLMPGTYATLATGQSSTCGIDATGAAFCSGTNVYGELGDGVRR